MDDMSDIEIPDDGIVEFIELDETVDVVAFTGRKRSGKDTASRAFVSQGYTQLSFAGPIKQMLASLLDCQGVSDATIHRMIEGDLKEIPTPYLSGRSPRYAMQTLGTEWGRNLMASDFWCDILVNTAAECDSVVISDLRFQNELEAVQHRLDGSVYRIIRPGLEISDDDHPSETEMDNLEVDGEIINDCPSAQEFAQQVYDMLLSDENYEDVH